MTARGEAALIESAQSGSVEAFTALVTRYRTGLLRFLVTRCRNLADAEDALQDTMLNAFRYLGSYDSRWRFSTWLYRIAIRNAGRLALPLTSTAEAVDPSDIGSTRDDPLVVCSAASESQNLWLTARRTLSDDAFAALWLRYVEDMSVNDIAMALERTPSWTKVNLMRARQVLAGKMATPHTGS